MFTGWQRLSLYSFIQSFIHSFIYPFIYPVSHSFIQSLRILSSHRSIDSSKANSPYSVIYSFLSQFPFSSFSLMQCSSCLRLLPRLSVPSISPSITCFRRQLLGKMWPILPFISRRMFFPPQLHVILHFSHDLSKWVSPSFSTTTF